MTAAREPRDGADLLAGKQKPLTASAKLLAGKQQPLIAPVSFLCGKEEPIMGGAKIP